MNILLSLFLAALTVAPADRLGLADRLFNKGEYAQAAAEYAALEGSSVLTPDALLYRRAECDRALGRTDAAQRNFRRIVEEYPMSDYADTAQLRLAYAATGAARIQALKALDADRVKPALRAEALFRLGEATQNAAAYERCVKVDPKGRFAPYALLHRGALLSKSSQPAERRKAVALFLEIAFGKDRELSESALYLAGSTSFADAQYSEAGSLVRRYLKNFPTGKHAEACREMSAWCEYLGGKYANAITLCGEGKTDALAYVRAAATQASGETARARTLLEAYLTDHPQGHYRKEAELALVRLDYAAAERAGNFAKCAETARRAFVLSGSAADRVRLAWACEKSGRTDEAVREYTAVAEKHPGTSEAALAMYEKAMIDLRAERWSAADLALREALAGKLDARYRAEAQYWRGMAACRLGHGEEGVAALRDALKTGLSLDQSREARLAIADVDFNAGRTNAAVKAYAALVREGATARMSAAKTLAVGHLMPSAEKKICAVALTQSETAEWRQTGYALLGEAEQTLGNGTAAAAAWEKCVTEACETEVLGPVAVSLGIWRSKKGDYAGAEQLLKRAVALNAKDNAARARAYLALAHNADAKGDREAAKGYATVVATLFENLPQAKEAAECFKAWEAK